MNNYSALTSRYLKEHMGRTILTLVGIIVAIAMFTAIGSIYYSEMNNKIEQAKAGKNFEVVFYDATKSQINVLSANAEIKNGGTAKEEGVLDIDSKLITDSLKKLNIRAYDGAAFKDVFQVEILEGRYPANSSEIVVDKKFYAIMKDKKLENVLKGQFTTASGESGQREYTVVGSYESPTVTNWAITYLDIKTSEDTADYGYYANLKQKSGKMDLASEIAKKNNVKLDINTRLLYLLGEGPDKSRNHDMDVIFGIIAAFVVVCTVVVIYNAFNISVMERIKHFGILRSIGATKSQIRRLVFREASIMSLIAIPVGIMSGFAGIMITFNLIMDGFLNTFKINFYPQVVIVAALLGLVTVFLSAFFPARTASRVSPIDAIRGTTVVKGDRIKRRRSLWAKLIFRFEGEVAYKNIKRNRKRFYTTCISLMISVVMFVFFSNFVDILIVGNAIVSDSIKVEGVLSAGQEGGNRSQSLSGSLPDKLNTLEGIKKLYKLNHSTVPLIIKKENVNRKFAMSSGLMSVKEYKGNYIIDGTQIIGYDKNAIELMNEDNNLKIQYEDLDKNNGVIIINKSAGTDENGKRFYDGFTSYRAGDEIRIPLLNEDYINKQEPEQLKKMVDSGKTMTFKVAGVIDYETIGDSTMFDSYGIIMSNENYSKLTGIKGFSTIAMNFDSTEYAEKNFERLNILADENKAAYTDVNAQMKQSDNAQRQLMVLVYGFIGLIVIISTVNIINTVTINLLVKKREYATFKAIGMTGGQFRKLVLLEGTLFGIIAAIIGLPVAFLLTYFGIIQNNPLGSIGYKIALWPYFYGCIGIVGITLLAAVIPLKKLNGMNIVEALRIEE